MWVNFNCGTELVKQEAIRTHYQLEFTQDSKVRSTNYLKPFIDVDTNEVDNNLQAKIVSASAFYPFHLSEHSSIMRPVINDFFQTPMGFAHLNGKDYLIFTLSMIKQNNHVLRLMPDEQESDNLRRLLDSPAIANVLKSGGYSSYKIKNPDIYHVKNNASIVELMSKFYRGIPLADVTKLVRLEDRIYSSKELEAMGLGELKLSRHGSEIPIIEQIAADEFVFYSRNYDDYQQEIDSLIIK